MKSLTILIIDTNEIERKSLLQSIKSLNHYSYNVLESENLNSVEYYIQNNDIDIIVLNSTNLEWNGLQTFNKIESDFPSISKIVIVENEKNPILEKLFEKKSNNFLIKNNFTNNELFKTINSVINSKLKDDEVNTSKSFYQSVIDSLEDSIAILDENSQIVYINNSFNENFNIWNNNENEILGNDYLEFISRFINDSTSIEEIENSIINILNGNQKKISEDYLLNKSGNNIWLSITLSNYSENNPKRIVATHKNISFEKNANKAKAISDRIFNHSIDLLTISGFDGYFKVLNPTWTKTLGWSYKELLRKPWIDFVHPDDRQNTLSILQNEKSTECIKFVNRFICKDNSYRWFAWNYYPYVKEDIIYTIIRDITDTRKVEEELLKSKKAAEKSDMLKSEFLTQISHEIRTPLNALLCFSSLIKGDLGDSITEDLNEAFHHMELAGNRIFRTIELLIKISELHTDNYEPVFTENNISELINELVYEFKPLAEKKNLDLRIISTVKNENLIFDKKSVFDVFSNLIDNAIKYTQKGSVVINVKRTLYNKVSVSVIDTGIGISEKFIGNMYNPFSQETTGYTRRFDGNGLGLALVKQYCDLNNAEIFASSEKGVGSNFTVIFN